MNQKTHLLFQRFGKGRSNKIQDLAEKSASGSNSGFQGIFQVEKATAEQRSALKGALTDYRPSSPHIFESDIEQLMQLMLEVKAISHQALLLHGQRIQSAKEILRGYREGAFTAWLQRAYGNRQTPYNFLQYFEFFQALPDNHRSRIEKMPRKVVYQLASRKQPLSKKLALLERCADCSTRIFLSELRRELPLKPLDKRRGAHPACTALERAKQHLKSDLKTMSSEEMSAARQLCQSIASLLSQNL